MEIIAPLKCSFCGSLVHDGGTRVVHDFRGSEVVTDVYKCSRKDCVVSAHNGFWGTDGTFYGHIPDFEIDRETYHALKGTIQYGILMAQAIEKKWKKNLFYMMGLKVDLEWRVECDFHGKITSTRPKIGMWKYDKNGDFYTRYIPGIQMLIFCIRNFHRMKKSCGMKYAMDDFNTTMQFSRGEWWRRVFRFYVIQRYGKLIPQDQTLYG